MENALAEYLSHAPVFVRTVPGTITHWTQGAQELYGYSWSQAQGRSSHELLKTRFPQPIEEIDAVLTKEGGWQGLLNHTRADGSQIWTESIWRLRSDAGEDRVVEVNTDVTTRELLSYEVNHRVKNNLAIVQGLARLTLGGLDGDRYARFEQRLMALARAHDLLSRTSWQEADLGDLVESVFESFGLPDQVRWRGPKVMLGSGSVIAYTLALHELTTNALKYGALSMAEGRVDLCWELVGAQGERIHLIWTESQGPRVTPPIERGFGATLIERVISAELGEHVALNFDPSGLTCEFDGPVQKRVRLSVADEL